MSKTPAQVSNSEPNWSQLSFNCSREQADQLSDALIELGAPSVQVGDANADTEEEEAIFGEPGSEDAFRGWRESRLTLLAPTAEQARDLLAQASAETGVPIPEQVTISELIHQDWVRTTQAQFDPMPVGDQLWITPSWHVDAPVTDRRISIVLDPGLAFGTGSHPTTRMCLQWLDAHPPVGQTVIDYGCGSGLLAIAAAKLGASRVIAIDIDEQALTSTRDNADINQVTIETRSTRVAMPDPAPVVVANILAGPLKVLAPLLQSLVLPGGQLILAGLLDSQADEVALAYPRISLLPWRSEHGWTCLAGKAAGNG